MTRKITLILLSCLVVGGIAAGYPYWLYQQLQETNAQVAQLTSEKHDLESRLKSALDGADVLRSSRDSLQADVDALMTPAHKEVFALWADIPKACENTPIGVIVQHGWRVCVPALEVATKGQPFPSAKIRRQILADPNAAKEIARNFFDEACAFIEGTKPASCKSS